MLGWCYAITLCSAWAASWTEQGTITGVVVNGSAQSEVVPGATVVLRVQNQGVLLPVMETTADEAGRFKFENLPLNEQLIFLPGANHQGIHYPGKRLRLNVAQPKAEDEITIYETVAEPSPLVAKRHDIDLRPEGGALRVTETILISNPTLRSYVGKTLSDDAPAVTLRLAIPSNFDKVTFDKEFFGRSFQVAEQGIETQIPWTPGEREIRFSYRLPIAGGHWMLKRPVDLPCESLRVSVARDASGEIVCNLPQRRTTNTEPLVFETQGTSLPSGFVMELSLGDLPFPWTTYARWIAVTFLAVLILATAGMVRYRRSSAPVAKPTAVRLAPATVKPPSPKSRSVAARVLSRRRAG